MARGRLILRTALAGCAALLLAACDPVETAAPAVSAPPQRPPERSGGVPVQVTPTSAESAELRSYLAQVQSAQLTQGLLRQDGGGPDTPFTAEMLARNFERLVFYNEYDSAFRGRGGPSPLRRWNAPVRMKVFFGTAVMPSQRMQDSKDVAAYAARLSRLTGHPVSVGGRPNFAVIFAGEDDRADALRQAAAEIPGLTADSLSALVDLRRDTYCVVAAFALGSDPNAYTAAVALIRGENPDLLRLSCIHEELAQGLGIANDSPEARPSIFNDDDEFALLTRQDELLLKMLYDARLSTGMTANEARPVTRTIANELVGRPAL
ncbi:DUF2927 domain-containing protein [Sulfitobacter sp. D35]|uniref:DUF2927 domain-containing protein n=1 Tax=Sulfitobacter sp. D35 TaxID=3083252 RepID=UPI00296F24F3|nr:DUF2927 domain-containing protein [Sulfitobacter sp. D35]MDW4499839.1 DUF2927 domain-containing protein [Sulfitobacter sp. D35]